MATISKKNIQTLIGKYTKNPKEFEGYIKHCVNILKNYNWLKENMYNSLIKDYEYFDRITKSIGTDYFLFHAMFQNYYSDFAIKIPIEKKKSIKTNIYYLDEIARITDVFGKLNNISSIVGNSSEIEDKQIDNKKANHSFCRMMFSIIEKNYMLDTSREYTFDEIYNLVLEEKIAVVDSYIASSDITEKELVDGIRSNEIMLVNSNVCPMIGNNSKTIESFFDMQGSIERKIWYTINMLFCRYVRYNMINFHDRKNNCINCNIEFYETFDHILEIISELKRYYKKKGKTLPKVYEDIIKNILEVVEKEKNKYENFVYKTNTKNYSEQVVESLTSDDSILIESMHQNGYSLKKKL